MCCILVFRSVEANDGNTVRIVRARDRIREVDVVNRRKLRVLQVAVEETWAVAKILEENQYRDDVEPDLVLARKEAERARKRKKEKEDVFSLEL